MQFSVEVISYMNLNVQGGPKKWGHYVWRLTSSAYVFKTLELISMIFDTLLLRFLLIISVDPKFIKFIVRSGATWRKLTTWVSLSVNAMTVQHKMFSRISLDKLQNRIDCSSVLKNGRLLETIHGRFEHHHCSKLCACWQFDLQWCVAESHAAWGISKLSCHLVCVL